MTLDVNGEFKLSRDFKSLGLIQQLSWNSFKIYHISFYNINLESIHFFFKMQNKV